MLQVEVVKSGLILDISLKGELVDFADEKSYIYAKDESCVLPM